MELFARFKKDYFNYLVSIILPALISGVSIPVFKRMLGAEGYGQFALWLNAILLTTSFITGWLVQSIIRFFPASTDKRDFYQRSLRLLILALPIAIIPAGILAWTISGKAILVVLCIVALISSSFQFAILPVAQSFFLSRKIITSEIIRTVIYFAGGILLITLTDLHYLTSLLLAVAISYICSFTFLYKTCNSRTHREPVADTAESNSSQLIRKFYSYGAPLSLWFVFTYLLTYIDKLFSIHAFGATYQGNYQAMFDFIGKSITLLITPVISALFPLLTAAYESGNRKEIRGFMIKIFLYEFSGFILVSIGYWLFGADLLFYVLDIPKTFNYELIGFIIICGTFVWQLAILIHKRFELNLKTKFLLIAVIIAFLCQVSFYYLMRETGNELAAPLGFLIASLVYFTIVSLPELGSILKMQNHKSGPGQQPAPNR